MPARVVVVHDNPDFIDPVVAGLRGVGLDVVTFTDTMSALNALEHAQRVELMITRVQFSKGQPSGVALARMAWMKRSGIKVLFVALPEMQMHTEGLGEFMAAPVATADVVAKVVEMLES